MELECGPGRILIVEDDPAGRVLLAEILSESGYGVDCAAHGQEALDHLRTAALPDLILLDMMMPVMDGWQFLRGQQSDARLASIPIIVISAIANQSPPLGAAGYLTKPITVPDLLDLVRRHCGGSRRPQRPEGEEAAAESGEENGSHSANLAAERAVEGQRKTPRDDP